MSFFEEYNLHKIRIPKADLKIMEEWVSKYENKQGYGVPHFLNYKESVKYNDLLDLCGDMLPEGKCIALMDCDSMSSLIVYCYYGKDKGKVCSILHDDIGFSPIQFKLYYKYCTKAFKIIDSFNADKGYTLKDKALDEHIYFESSEDVLEFFCWTNAGYVEKLKENFVMTVPENRSPLRRDLVDKLEVNPHVLDRINKIEWFSNCGKQNLECPFKIKYVKSFKEAEKYSSGNKWSNLLLNFQNELSVATHSLSCGRQLNWNSFVRSAKDNLISEIKRNVQIKLEELRAEYTEETIGNIMYIMVQFLLEDHFRPVYDVTFCEHLFNVIEKGYIPCGWDGNFPVGSLIVY